MVAGQRAALQRDAQPLAHRAAGAVRADQEARADRRRRAGRELAHARLHVVRVLGPDLEALRASGSAIELNTAGWHKPA